MDTGFFSESILFDPIINFRQHRQITEIKRGLKIKIIRLENGSNVSAVTIRARLGTQEFQQLKGNISDLCVVATRQIKTTATIIKTGANHSHTKYFLFPAILRKQFPLADYDFSNVLCGVVPYKQSIYVVYRVPQNGF